MYISKVSNTWILNTQTFSLIKCVDLSVLSTLYITHTKPLPIPTWHYFFKVPPLCHWFQTQGCIYLYNWNLCPSSCPGSSSTRLLFWLILNKVSFFSVKAAVLAHPQQGVLLQVILFSVSQGCLNLNCWSTSCCSPPWWQVGSYIHYILYVNCAGFRYQTRLLFLAAASLWFGN